ncbi:S41 family peptidase [Maricaulis sp.]|uniref:S41 family peptidase n=1 Tax=Maricaulis sp. TaxID=1486257 RepID=UPI003A9182FB
MKTLFSILALVLIGSAADAQDDAIDPASRSAAIAEIGTLIADNYFDAGLARQIATSLDALNQDADIETVTSGNMLAAILTDQLQQTDRHFEVRWRGAEQVAQTRAEWAAQEAQEAGAANEPADPDRWASLRRNNFAFGELSLLEANVGYLNLTGFAPLEPAEPTARAALAYLAHTDALIIDLRENGGGSPDMVQYLLSHFLPAGSEVLYNTFLPRAGEPVEMRTLPAHPAGHRPDVPLYILIGPETLSAAEALAYHLQAMQRATLVGETTAGGANPGDFFLASSGYSVFIPTATSRNPVTGTNWDGIGVTPDIAVPAGLALDQARLEIYRQIAATSEVPDQAFAADWQAGLLAAELDPWVPSERQLQAYAGQYGPRHVSVVDGELVYQREGQEAHTLLPLRENMFRFAETSEYRLEFAGAGSGRADTLILRLENGAMDASPRSP